MDAIETFWTRHTVRDDPFASSSDSLDYLDWRSGEYPLFHDLMGLWGDHSGETVLDFGCGPANDLVGLLVHGRAEHAIGVDVSATAIELAGKRLALHGIDTDRYTLVKISAGQPIPIHDESVDYIYSQGVLHHLVDPQVVLSEFYRVLRPGGTSSVMVYNRDSLYFHLYVAYHRMVLGGSFAGMTVENVFRQSTDGPDCPRSIAYRASDFLEMCRSAGFIAEFRGGYFVQLELDLWATEGEQAMRDERLGEEHHQFLRSLEPGVFPSCGSLPAGIGGVFRLRK